MTQKIGFVRLKSRKAENLFCYLKTKLLKNSDKRSIKPDNLDKRSKNSLNCDIDCSKRKKWSIFHRFHRKFVIFWSKSQKEFLFRQFSNQNHQNLGKWPFCDDSSSLIHFKFICKLSWVHSELIFEQTSKRVHRHHFLCI